MLLYYAGHGLQHDGTTYLVPTNAESPVTPANIQDTCVCVGELMVMICKREPRVKLFVIDACQTKLDPGEIFPLEAGSGEGSPPTKRRSPDKPTVPNDDGNKKRGSGEGDSEENFNTKMPKFKRVQSWPLGLRVLKQKHVGIQNVTDLFQSDLGRNIYTLYASSPGTVALETFRGGVFSNAFLENIAKPTVTLSKLCSSISDDIKKLGYGNQLPTMVR